MLFYLFSPYFMGVAAKSTRRILYYQLLTLSIPLV